MYGFDLGAGIVECLHRGLLNLQRVVRSDLHLCKNLIPTLNPQIHHTIAPTICRREINP